MGKKKVNPKRRPATAADIKKAKDLAQGFAISAMWTIFFTVLRDKEGYEEEGLRRVWEAMEDLSDSIAKGYVDLNDLRHTLKVEAGIELTMEKVV